MDQLAAAAVVSEDVILTREAFARFWFRYDESPVEAQLAEYAQSYPAARATLERLHAEIAEYWPMLVEECRRCRRPW